jgi:hypothetical protein
MMTAPAIEQLVDILRGLRAAAAEMPESKLWSDPLLLRAVVKGVFFTNDEIDAVQLLRDAAFLVFAAELVLDQRDRAAREAA